MLEVRDRKDQMVFIDDVVRLTEDVGEYPAGTEAIVVTVLGEVDVQLDPKNAGIPFYTEPSKFEVIFSEMQQVLGLADLEELQEILLGNEEAFKYAEKKPRKSGSGASKKQVTFVDM